MGTGRRFLPLALAVLMVATAIGGASAQPDTCAGLETRLAVLDRQARDAWDGGTGAIDRSIDQQSADLERTVAEARRSACMGNLLGLRKPAPGCRSLTARIGKIQANLNRLNAQKRRLAADPYAAERQRSGLLRALAANGCGDGYTVYGASGGLRGHGVFETVFGNGRIRSVWGPADYGADDFSYGTFRTLCVRTCDGYYFPISFTTVESHFSTDERTCRARCPGTDVALYVHRNPGAEAGDAMSLAGEPYRSLSTAFRYRKEFDATCRCGTVVASMAPVEDATAFVTIRPPDVPLVTYGGILPTPEARPQAAEDPETEANRAGRFAPDAARPAQTETGTITTAADGRTVRVVGPSFYVPRNGRPISLKPLPAPPDER